MKVSSISPKITSFAVGSIIITGIVLHQREFLASYYRRRRGLRGLTRWIWLGDYLPPRLRQSMDELNKVDNLMATFELNLEKIEISIERMRLDSVDGKLISTDEHGNASILQQNPQLRTQIGVMSNDLDKLAASIDSIKSHSDYEVKQRKKLLSNEVVKLMHHFDSLISSLNT